MAVTREEKEARRLWEEHCKRVQSLTELSPEAERETRAQRDARIRRLLANYPAFSRVLLPTLHAPYRPRHGHRDGHRTQRPLPQCRLPWAAAAACEVWPGTGLTGTKQTSQAPAGAPGHTSLRGAPRHLHPYQPHGARRWGDPLRARNAGLRNLAGYKPHKYPANFAGVRRRPVAPWTQEAGATPGLHRHRRP